MKGRAAVTVNRPREEVQRLWESSEYRPEYVASTDAAVTFKDAPGDRGTEIHVDLSAAGGGGLAGALKKLSGGDALTKVKEDLRRFKQHVETGEIPRSDGTPEGERAERKVKQRPAQPLEESELEKAGVA
jgi:uncharacterized membrane protein